MDITPRSSAATDDIDWMLIVRYLAGECSPIEVGAVEAWVAGAPHRAERLQRLREASVGAPTREYHFDVDSAWGRLSTVPGVRQAQPTGPARPAGRPRPWPRGVGGRGRWRGAAIVASGAVAVSVAATVGVVRRHGAGAAAHGQEYVTAAGQRRSVTLVDGTRLTLAPASRVRLAADYGASGRPRKLELDGEAYFAVVHDATRAFTVQTRSVVARDVGTAFDVRAYVENRDTRIAVVEGGVSVRSHPVPAATAAPPSGAVVGDVLVNVGDVATIGTSGVVLAHGADVRAFTSWTRGELTFRDTPLREVAAELSRWYGLNVTVTDSALATRPVTGTYTSEPADDVMRSVAHAVGMTLRWSGRTVQFVMAEAH